MTLTPGMKVHRMDMTLACMQERFQNVRYGLIQTLFSELRTSSIEHQVENHNYLEKIYHHEDF